MTTATQQVETCNSNKQNNVKAKNITAYGTYTYDPHPKKLQHKIPKNKVKTP